MKLRSNYKQRSKARLIVGVSSVGSQSDRVPASPVIISDDADGLVGVRRPRDWPLGDHLPQGEDVGSRVAHVDEVLKHPRLVGEVRRFREGRVP